MSVKMQVHNFPFAVRMIGFAEDEAKTIAANFAHPPGKGYGYFHLQDDNLQDPDLYLVNADELKALVTLSDLTPSAVRPALLIGTPHVELPYPCLDRPLKRNRLLQALDELVEKRADALSRLGASGIVTVPERRRHDRLDHDLTDPSEFERMRVRGLTDGGILIVDKNPAFRAFVAELLGKHDLPIAWVSDENKAINLCSERNFSLVLVNTSTPGIESYGLCEEIKQTSAVESIAVVFLVSKPFVYEVERARKVKVDGFMNKPVASHHLISVLKKFIPALSR
jgi:CheY-like chemotaxis protein